MPDLSTSATENSSNPQPALLPPIFRIFAAFPDYDRGNRLYASGRYEAAIVCYGKAVQIKPDWARAWLNLGKAYKQLHSYAETVGLLRSSDCN
jgi:Tetratricopeptide repeat.